MQKYIFRVPIKMRFSSRGVKIVIRKLGEMAR